MNVTFSSFLQKSDGLTPSNTAGEDLNITSSSFLQKSDGFNPANPAGDVLKVTFLSFPQKSDGLDPSNTAEDTKSQFLGHFSCAKTSKVSQNCINHGFWDTFHALRRLKCPKIAEITAFGTLFMR